MNLFFFPYAGANRYSYHNFFPFCRPVLQPHVLELPGRGGRFQERLLYDLEAMAKDLFSGIEKQLDKPYAFYGHSMGTLLVYMVTDLVAKKGLPAPLHLFLSGRHGLEVHLKEFVHSLPTGEFIEELKALGGFPKDLAINGEVEAFFLPIIRADFQAAEKFKKNESFKCKIPVTVMKGGSDLASQDIISDWQEITEVPIETLLFKGDHFFIRQHSKAIVDLIKSRLGLPIPS